MFNFSNEPNAYESVDRVKFMAVVVPISTKTAVVLPMVSQIRTSKSDQGDAGTFNISFPLAAPQAGATQDQITGVTSALQYAQYANPMDVVAIYAQRTVSKENTGELPIGPMSTGALQLYGIKGFIDQLQAPSLIFVGMVDHASVKGSPGGSMALVLTGRDLTKIFYENDTNIPQTAVGALASPDGVASPYAIAIDSSVTGTQLVLTALDIMCAKDIGPGDATGGLSLGDIQSFNANFGKYGYPWRNFISTSQLDPLFTPIGQGENPPFSIQAGSTWANMTEIRYAPLTRLFVDELGNLIFDDAFAAWTGGQIQNIRSAASSDIVIAAEEVLDYEFYISDDDLATLLQVRPMAGLVSGAGGATLAALNGYFPQDPAAISSPLVPAVAQTVIDYGYRLGDYTSYWDLLDTTARLKYLLLNHNSLCFARLTVRGRPIYRVGLRAQILVPAHRAEFQDATWYIQECEHDGQFGQSWTTSLFCRYPMDTSGNVH